MRTFVRHGITGLAIAMLSIACADANKPASSPTPQAPVNDPSVQQPNDPISNNTIRSQKPASDPQPQTSALESPTPQTPFGDPNPQKPFYGPGTTNPNGDGRVAKSDKPLTDAEVIGVAAAANDGETQMAEVALKKATAADVKQFAGMMKTHHSAALQKGKALQTKTKITSAESDLSSSLKSDVGTTIKDLKAKEGKAFDKAYIESQVKAHKDVLSAIDNRLVPSASNGEVKSMLTEMRRAVADHLTKAEDLQKKLDTTVSSIDGDSDKSSGKTVEGKAKARSTGQAPLDRR